MRNTNLGNLWHFLTSLCHFSDKRFSSLLFIQVTTHTHLLGQVELANKG